MEAMSGRTDDKYHSREWSRTTNDVTSFPCYGREASASVSNLVGEICRLVIYDQPAEQKHGGGGSKLRDGKFDLFP